MIVHRFRAMGTEVELLLDAPERPPARAALAEAEREFERLERMLSRFRADSELSRLNRDGLILGGSAELVEVVGLALEARERSGGAFDPTVHDALAAAGYDRTFDLVGRAAATRTGHVSLRCGGAVRVDVAGRSVRLAPGVRLDLGGIAKGYAVDRVCARLSLHGPCVVNAGGDLAARGCANDVAGWPIGVELPTGTLTLLVRDGAVATSGRDRRRWRGPDGERHHLIDPETARPSRSDVVRATVVAGSAVEAEVLATSLFLAGADDAVREADLDGTPCVIVTGDGRTLLAGGLA